MAGARAEAPSIGLSPWRHIAASIIKVKFAREREAFNIKGNNSNRDHPNSDNSEDKDVATLAWMSNHSVRTHNRAYANTTRFQVANMWDGLIKCMYQASLLWATFFYFREEEDLDIPLGSRRRRVEVNDGRGMVKQIAITLPTPCRHWSGPALLREARQLLQDDHLQWQYPEQEQAMYTVASSTPKVFVVLATRIGKSLLF